MNKKWRNVLGYGFGLLVLGVILYLGGTRAIELALTPHLGYLFACFLANITVFAASAFRWGYTTNQLVGKKITSYPRYFSYFVSSRFFGQYISQAGGDFVVKPGLLKQINGIPLKSGLSTIVVEKLFDLSLIGILVIPSLLFLFKAINEFLALVIILIFLILFISVLSYRSSSIITLLLRFYSFGLRALNKIPLLNRVIKNKDYSAYQSHDNIQAFHKKVLLNIFSLTLLRFLFLVLRLYLLNESLGLGIPVAIFVAGIPIAQLALALALTPGALGFLEGGWFAVLALGGIGEIERSAFLIGQRAYWSIFIGLIFLITYILFGINNFLRKETKD
jgi:uncharacterized protein (TIRG00374 family)